MSNPIVATSIWVLLLVVRSIASILLALEGAGPSSPSTAACVCLNGHLFANLNEARQIIEEWRIDYNTNRSHTSLNGLTLTELATRPNRGQTQNRLYL